MNEKRFKLTTEEDICYCEYTYWKGDEPLGMEEVVDVLNEQQATIERLQNDIIRKDEVIRILKEWLKKR